MKEVYVGLRYDAEYEIYEALLDKHDVKVFKMQICKNDIYSLEAVEIDRAKWFPTKSKHENSKSMSVQLSEYGHVWRKELRIVVKDWIRIRKIREIF